MKEAIDILRPVAGSRDIGTTLSAQMRYRGQGYEITVPLQLSALQTRGESYLRSAFERSYRHLYGRVIPNKDIEILGWTARGEVPLQDAASGYGWSTNSACDQRKWTLVEQAGGEVSALAFNRESLDTGQKIAGPALVVDTGTTVLIPSGFFARVLAGGHLLLTRLAVEAVESAA
jgi:N-methylhydantoinase A